MKTCKIKPHISTCRMCNDVADSCNAIPDCKKCSHQITRYDLIQIGSNFWGSYAIVQVKGKLEKVSLDRVYDIQEKERNNEKDSSF